MAMTSEAPTTAAADVKRPGELSDSEEARILQYRCETLEAAIAERGISISDSAFSETLKRFSTDGRSHFSHQFGSWLDRNLGEFDTMVRSARNSDYANRSLRFASFKCPYEWCLAYVYGLPTPETRDQHMREHQEISIKRDSAHFITPPIAPFHDQPPSVRQLYDNASHTPTPGSTCTPQQHHTQVPVGGPQLPPLGVGMAIKSEPGSIASTRTPEEDAASELTAMKHGYSHGYSHGAGPAVETKPVHDIDWIVPRQHHSLKASASEQAKALDEFLERTYSAPNSTIDYVMAGLDWKDDFWICDSSASVSGRPIRPPQMLAVLLASNSVKSSLCNFVDVLCASRRLSANRLEEKNALPALFYAKALLRQTLLYDLIQQTPVLALSDRASYPPTPGPPTPGPLEMLDHERYFDLVREAMASFLDSFQTMTMRKGPLSCAEWFAGFLALCLFSIVKYIVSRRIEMTWRPTLGSGAVKPADELKVLDDVYRVVVTIFVHSSPIIDENNRVMKSSEDAQIMNGMNDIIHRDNWPNYEVSSIANFLYHVGARHPSRLSFIGVPPVPPTQPPRMISLPPLVKSTDPRPDSHRSWLATASPALDGFDRFAESPKILESPRHGRVRSESLYSRGPESPLRPGPRSSLRRFICDRCSDYPDGFSNEVDYRRHFEARHGNSRRAWLCIEPANITPDMPRPTTRLSLCNKCHRKHFKSFQAAAIHLQRHHFHPNGSRAPSGPVSEYVPTHMLRDWIKEVWYVPEERDRDRDREDSDDEIAAAATTTNTTSVGNTNTPTDVRPPLVSNASGTALSSPRSALSNLPYVPAKTPENRTRCPFPDCGRVFKDLNSHMLTHQEQRPEKCPIESCEYHTKGFARKYDKNRHALTHYKGTMICPFCHGTGTGYEKAFNRADVFKRHLTSIHHVEQAPPNSRRPLAGASRAPPANNHSTVNPEAQCSICQGRFTTAQEFYEHLDECVLNEIVPSGQSPKHGPAAGTGAGTGTGAGSGTGGKADWSDAQSVQSQGSTKSKAKAKDKTES
ncbi:hypothetical protein TD95_004032 [Thielaviopsis punctulata]|uniref:C2H2-type domain-containing protein n=1 Tax=Thielaviopsis punctulata TaxID=72032 RepID=A0A0F4ZFK9_9PEZI|nr:hypothetical protein TD95_004032 [Thielaviopsis punctulata]